jgi:hypothetical protein
MSASASEALPSRRQRAVWVDAHGRSAGRQLLFQPLYALGESGQRDVALFGGRVRIAVEARPSLEVVENEKSSDGCLGRCSRHCCRRARPCHLILDLRTSSSLRDCVWCGLVVGQAISLTTITAPCSGVGIWFHSLRPREADNGLIPEAPSPGSTQNTVSPNIEDRGRSPLAREVCDSATSNRLAGDSGLLDTCPGPSR